MDFLGVRQITVDRDSVCMGDDVTAPNARTLDIGVRAMLSEVLERVAAYLPNMHGTIWTVDSGRQVLAYILMADDGRISLELCQPDRPFRDLEIKALHCQYFPPWRFTWKEKTGEIVEKYPECGTLLDKVKRCMGDYFREEILIKGGSLCIWGEWFGRPYDNFHALESVRWKDDMLMMKFRDGESLSIRNPVGLINEEKRFIVEDAASVLWVWYGYGREQTYHNMYVRQYVRRPDGTILRAEGKRGDVHDGDGRAVHPADGSPACRLS